jgi:undecaprenyl-diphosphatase
VLVILTVTVIRWEVLPVEAMVRTVARAWTSPQLVELARITRHGGTWRILPPAIALGFLLSPAARQRWWLWLAVLASAPIAGDAWQELALRRRPEGEALGFPSGHATSAACFAVVVSYLAGRERLGARMRWAIRAMAGGLMAAVGLARVVVGAHWPGDVLAGLCARYRVRRRGGPVGC